MNVDTDEQKFNVLRFFKLHRFNFKTYVFPDQHTYINTSKLYL